MGMGLRLTAAVACAGLLVGCTGDGQPKDDQEGVPATAGSTPGPESATTAPGSPTAAPTTVEPTPTAPITVEPTPAAPSPAAVSEPPQGPTAPPSQPDQPTGIQLPDPAAATAFDQCAQRYQQLSADSSLTDVATPVVIEGWALAFEQASSLAAEGDYAGAATACQEVLAAMEPAFG